MKTPTRKRHRHPAATVAPGRSRAKRRPDRKVVKHCSVCGDVFTCTRAHARECSAACRKRLQRFRTALRAIAPRLPPKTAAAALHATRLVWRPSQPTTRKPQATASPRPLHSPKARNKRKQAQ